MVFQFPAFDRWKFPTQKHFLEVLAPFLEKLPRDRKFAACDTTDGLRRTLYMARAVFNVTIRKAVRSQVFQIWLPLLNGRGSLAQCGLSDGTSGGGKMKSYRFF